MRGSSGRRRRRRGRSALCRNCGHNLEAACIAAGDCDCCNCCRLNLIDGVVLVKVAFVVVVADFVVVVVVVIKTILLLLLLFFFFFAIYYFKNRAAER